MSFHLSKWDNETEEQFEARKADYKKRTEHLFVSSCDGHLYDTRIPDWSSKEPLRKNFHLGGGQRKSYKLARNVAALIRCGQFAFPGGYEKSFILDDGTTLCYPCFTEEFLTRSNLNHWSRNKKTETVVIKMDVGVSVEILYEGNCPCENCNRNLAVYGDPEEEEEESEPAEVQG